MQLKKIILKNFRSAGPEGLELLVAPTTNTIIGENNVGKSSIFEAFKILKNPQIAFNKEDWHASDQRKTILLRIECLLDSQQIQKIIEVFELPYNESEYKNNFSDSITYSFEKSLGNSYLNLNLGFLQIENGSAFITKPERNRGFPSISWDNIIKKISLAGSSIPLREVIIGVAYETIGTQKGESYFGIPFRDDVSKKIIDIIMEKIIIIDEFRERPQHARTDFFSTPTGKDLASVLNKIKNSRPVISKKYAEIRKMFKHLYPNLDIEVIDEDNIIRILTIKGSIESTTPYLGSGIIQSLLLLTHMIAHSDKVLCIDTPETHLHPHAQRRLGSLIEASKESQILLITHSQYFLNINRYSRVFRFIQVKGKSNSITPDEKYFSEDDFNIFKKILDIDTKEFIFSRKVILVEGQSEQWVLPIFASSLNYNFDEYGISVISVNGKNNFKTYVKLIEGFKIPWFIFADHDAQPQIDEIKTIYNETHAMVLPATLEKLFPDQIYTRAQKAFNGNKSLIAKEAAHIMIEENMEIPDEIKSLIKMIQ